MPLRRKILFSGTTVVGFPVVTECPLRLIGFQYNTQVERMSFTFPIDEYNQNSQGPLLQRGDELFSKPTASVLGHNSYGFDGPEISQRKKPGV